jgi:anti-sigma-K factor RskA
MQNDHPQEAIPAYVLGALDADEARRVREHLAACQLCRDEAEAFQAVVTMLPYASGAQNPPPRVKRQLLARVSAAQETPPPQLARPAAHAPAAVPLRARLASYAAVAAVAVAAALGYVALETSAQADRLAAQNAESQRVIADLRAQLGQDDQIVSFIANPETVSQEVPATRLASGASALMYMQPGHNQVVLVVHGLPPLAPGKMYRLWLASEAELVPMGSGMPRDGGVTQFHGYAPKPMDTYAQVMVTVEDIERADRPSEEVLFETEL